MAILHVKTPNGTQKDIDVDKIFTTDGGTINGTINILNAEIQGHGRVNKEPKLMFIGNDLEDFDGYTEVCGANGWERGGSLFVYGLNCEGDGIVPGGFSLNTWDGEQHHTLAGTKDGYIVWDSKELVAIDSYGVVGENFYIRYTNGIQECIGFYKIPANTPNGQKTFTFQVPFVSEYVIRSLQLTAVGVLDGRFANVIVGYTPNGTTFKAQVETLQATIPQYDVYFWMRAVGYWK